MLFGVIYEKKNYLVLIATVDTQISTFTNSKLLTLNSQLTTNH